MKLPLFSIVLSLFAGLAGFAATGSQNQSPALLPQQFGGWQMLGNAQTSSDAATADPANARVLQEYRFTDLAFATYTRDDGRTLKVRGARFADTIHRRVVVRQGSFGAGSEIDEIRSNRWRNGRQRGRAHDILLRVRNVIATREEVDERRQVSGVTAGFG